MAQAHELNCYELQYQLLEPFEPSNDNNNTIEIPIIQIPSTPQKYTLITEIPKNKQFYLLIFI